MLQLIYKSLQIVFFDSVNSVCSPVPNNEPRACPGSPATNDIIWTNISSCISAREGGDIPYLMINPIYYYSGEVQCVHGTPPLPNICHKIGYFANSFMIFTFSASHQKFYFKGLIEEGSNRASPTIKGRSSIPTHTFNFCDT